MLRALYPGSFDPVTYGHLDVITRASSLYDELIVAVAPSAHKKPLFSLQERLGFFEELLEGSPKVRAMELKGLAADFADGLNAQVLVRGLRAISDFEYEFQMAQMNRRMQPKLETVFLMPSERYFYISSHLIKSVAGFSSQKVADLVPPNVLKALELKHKEGPLR